MHAEKTALLAMNGFLKWPLAAARLLGLLLWVLAPSWAHAAGFEFRAPRSADDAGAPAVMRDLAERVLPVYEEPDTERYLANLCALQLAAGDFKAADDTRQTLRERRRNANTAAAGPAGGSEVMLGLYAQAKAREAQGEVSFAQAFSQSFRDTVPALSDRDAYAATAGLGAPLSSLRHKLEKSFDLLRTRDSIDFPEAMDLVWTYVSFEAYRAAGPLLDTLAGEDDRRRYVVEDIKIPGGAGIYARLVRPKRGTKFSTLLEFTLVPAADDARACAARGYAGVVAHTRGKRPLEKEGPLAGKPSRVRITPFEHDGEDARTVIRWIARQAWSDGKVGMYGDGYGGFAAWAAAKRPPSALKAIATADAMAPGIDFPMEGQVFRNTAYRWAETHTLATTAAASGDPGQQDNDWRALDQAWYRSGKRYRDLDVLAHPKSKPNRVFRRWLGHPSYDHYWQNMLPFREQFAGIGIPALTMTGYYAAGAAGAGEAGGSEVGALHYFRQHLRYRPKADHTLVIGPYADTAMRDRPPAAVRGYAVDAAALIDLRELRFQWFDHIFRGSGKPALLKDRVNYQVMGANEWRHAPTLEAMANGALKFYLAPGSGDRHRLAPARPAGAASIPQTVDLADRNDANTPPMDIAGKTLPGRHAFSFVSEPLPQALEISGLLSGQLDLQVNKMDLDLSVALYEQLPSGDYVLLADPYEFRASYARDRVHRRLLKAGKRQQLAFKSEQITSRKLQAGSRVVLVLGVNKRPDRQINYGRGNDVSEESIADAGVPMKIQWYGGSYIDVPVRK
jgi:hypothetical protein